MKVKVKSREAIISYCRRNDIETSSSFFELLWPLCGTFVEIADIDGADKYYIAGHGIVLHKWMFETENSEKMTKFSVAPSALNQEQPAPKKTVFTKYVNLDASILEPIQQPHYFEHVELLWRDLLYGDVFVAWNGDGKNRTIYFGEAGDEFGQLPPKP